MRRSRLLLLVAASLAGCRGVEGRGAGWRNDHANGSGTAPAVIRAPDAPAVGPVDARGGEAIVPALVGLPIDGAILRAQRAGFDVVSLRVPGAPAGQVISQAPEAGALAPEGTPIGVRVAAGVAGEPEPAMPPSTAIAPAMPSREPAPPESGDVLVPNVVDRPPAVARRILADVGLAMTEQPGNGGVVGLVTDQVPLAGMRTPRGSTVTVRVPGSVAIEAAPTPAVASSPPPADADLGSPDGPSPGANPPRPPTPPATPAPVEPAPPPVPAPTPPTAPNPPASEPAGLEIPQQAFPEDGSVFRGDAKVRVEIEWLPVEHATAYLIEVEERTAETWTPILRRVVADAKAAIEIEPADPKHGDYRWRVRSVLDRRGGKASSWRMFAMR